MKLSKFMSRLLGSKDLKLIGVLFFTWRVTLLGTLFLSLTFLSLSSNNFLGGGRVNYTINPAVFAWANFDGEHYLSIARNGYGKLDHAFFPLYPILIKLLAWDGNLTSLALSGLLISNLSFLATLFILWQLVRIDFSKTVALFTIVSLLLFPTSFYFGSVYSESLFLLLVVSSFYCGRRSQWFPAGILAALASMTRVSGILLFPALLLEWWIQRNSQLKSLSILPLGLIPLGLFGYMSFLISTTGDPLAFYNELATFGVQRQGNFILLPQVFYRYLKMLITVDLPQVIYWTVFLELVSATAGLTLLIWGILKKVRLSYLLYGALSFILPTLTGSFSSLPRYLLVIFPIFITLGVLLANRSIVFKIVYVFLMATILIIETALFLRGYWVA